MSEAIYTHLPCPVRALQWTGENLAEVEKFVGAPRCAASNPETGRLYIYTADGVKCVFANDWLYIDERRELHALYEPWFYQDFAKDDYGMMESDDTVMHHPV